MATYAIVGVSPAIANGQLSPEAIEETVVRLWCMAGLSVDQAVELARRPHPPLPEE